MTRPLIITDCDEVLLYMISHYRDWLDEEHGVIFDMRGRGFARSTRYRDTGELLEPDAIWELLELFFDGEMHRQSPVEGAVEAIGALREHADVVVLTNLRDHRREARARQLSALGLDLRVFTNQGLKGPALKAILDEYRPSRALFIDDIAQHHGSVAEVAPHVARLHLCAEPLMAPHIDCAHKAGNAHARIDDWASALPWLLDRIHNKELA